MGTVVNLISMINTYQKLKYSALKSEHVLVLVILSTIMTSKSNYLLHLVKRLLESGLNLQLKSKPQQLFICSKMGTAVNLISMINTYQKLKYLALKSEHALVLVILSTIMTSKSNYLLHLVKRLLESGSNLQLK